MIMTHVDLIEKLLKYVIRMLQDILESPDPVEPGRYPTILIKER